MADGMDALGGVTVVEFGGYAAGPAIGKYLANFGARVIHVESQTRPDGFRLQYPPYPSDRVGVNRSGCFAIFNDSKFGVTLNLKNPAGVALACRLVEKAQIVIENMRPGVIDRLGLGYDRLRRVNPSLVMLSTSNLGQTGRYATHPGFGSQLSSLCGFTHLTGTTDGPPQLLYGPYIDFVAVVFGGAAVLAALDRQRRTNQGAFIDLSQYETGLQFLGGTVLDHAVNGGVEQRCGNHDTLAIPHGCYRVRDERWCVISCWDDAEWGRFCDAVSRPDWQTDQRFGTASQRRRHESDLNDAIAAQVLGEDGTVLMLRLQRAGVHAAVVNSIADLFSDPQLAARNIWQEQVHPEIGRHHYRMVAYQLHDSPGRVRSPAPCLGQHNDHIFRDWLGVSTQELKQAEAAEAFS
ncbi:MAG: CoA transferase [Gemmatimonadetes bacterium]|nr:CoA transferase [Gemmatimonadota bacterium]